VNSLKKMNGCQTRRTLTFLIITCGSYVWTQQNISPEAKEHWWTEGSLAVNVGPLCGTSCRINEALLGFTKDIELVWKVGWTFRADNRLPTLHIERYKWLSIFSAQLWNTEYNIVKAIIFGGIKMFRWNFLMLLKNISPINREILVEIPLSIIEKSHFVR